MALKTEETDKYLTPAASHCMRAAEGVTKNLSGRQRSIWAYHKEKEKEKVLTAQIGVLRPEQFFVRDV